MESHFPERDFRHLTIDAGRHVALAAAGVGGTAVLVQLTPLGSGILGTLYPLKALAWLGVIAALTLPALRLHLPHARFGPANRVTLLRAALIALIGGLLGEAPAAGGAPALAWIAFVIAIAALALDAIDGWVARSRGCASAFGARFDMELDAVFTLILALTLFDSGQTGAWVLAAGLWRYLFAAAGIVLPWLRRPLPPSTRRRTICALSVIALIFALAPPVGAPLSMAMAALAVAALSHSFICDIVWLARQHRETGR